MAEIRKIDFEKVKVYGDKENRDYIPSNWYIPAQKSWEVVAWMMVQLYNGATIRTEKEMVRFIHQYWKYIEEHAFAYGKENEE